MVLGAKEAYLWNNRRLRAFLVLETPVILILLIIVSNQHNREVVMNTITSIHNVCAYNIPRPWGSSTMFIYIHSLIHIYYSSIHTYSCIFI